MVEGGGDNRKSDTNQKHSHPSALLACLAVLFILTSTMGLQHGSLPMILANGLFFFFFFFFFDLASAFFLPPLSRPFLSPERLPPRPPRPLRPPRNSPAYSFVLPQTDAVEGARLIRWARDNQFVDYSTRAVIADMSVLNGATNQVITIGRN